jgi:hypothetical protein
MNDDELKDFFAGMALIGLLSNPITGKSCDLINYADVAYSLSNEMLEARKKEKKDDC